MTLSEIRKAFAFIEFLSDADAIKVLQEQPRAIALLDDPSYQLQRTALEYGGSCIFRHIKDPHGKICKMAIKMDYTNIVYVKNPSVELQLYAIKQNYRAYHWIPNAGHQAKRYYKNMGNSYWRAIPYAVTFLLTLALIWVIRIS